VTRGRRVSYVVAGLLLAGGASFWFRFHRSHAVAPKPSPSVLLVSIDTLRADHVGAYGAKVSTPTMDALANEGVLFERAVSHVPLTLPSHTSLFTATYPIAHGVRDNGAFRLSPSHVTMATILREHGYRTGAFVGAFPLDSRFGLDRGFEVYDDAYGEASAYDAKIADRPADDVLKPAVAWIEARAGKRYFAFVHLYDPHSPYAPPRPFAARFPNDLYSGEIAYVDDALGRFFSRLAAAGRMENTIVVITADHGEGLGEHGEKTHGMFAYDATLHVPLIFHWKDALSPGVRVAARVRSVNRRFSKDFFLQGSFDYQWRSELRAPTLEGTSPLFSDPLPVNFVQNNNAAVSLRQKNTSWQFRILGRYVLPHEIAVSGNVRVTSGFNWAPIQSADVPGAGTVDFFTSDLDRRSETVPIVDFRAEKAFKINARHRVTGMVDFYNVFNSNSEVNFILRTGSAFRNLIAVLDPRTVKVGIRYQF